MPASGKGKGKRGSSKGRKATERPSSVHAGKTSAKPRKSGKKSGKNSGSAGLSPVMHWIVTLTFAAVILLLAWLFLIRPYSYRWKPCLGSKDYGVCIPNGYNAYGMDVSHHQGTIDWKDVAGHKGNWPLRFVFIKATEGGSFLDENYSENIAAARAAGLVCSSYHFYNPGTSPGKQADFFISHASVLKGDLPPVLDIERTGNNTDALQREILEWLRIVEKQYGVKPIVYCSYKFRKNYLTSPEFDKYRFWIAHYYVERPAEDCEWTFWQFTDRGIIDGIGERTDLNAFNGTLQDFESLRVP